MAKKTIANPPPQQKTKRRKSPAANKRAGNNFELEIVHKLNEIGYDTGTSRQHSRDLDNSKVDVFDKRGDLTPLIQAKYQQVFPNWFEIQKECPIKDKPFAILWKKASKEGKNSPGTVAVIPASYFYELLKIELEWKKSQ